MRQKTQLPHHDLSLPRACDCQAKRFDASSQPDQVLPAITRHSSTARGFHFKRRRASGISSAWTAPRSPGEHLAPLPRATAESKQSDVKDKSTRSRPAAGRLDNVWRNCDKTRVIGASFRDRLGLYIYINIHYIWEHESDCPSGWTGNARRIDWAPYIESTYRESRDETQPTACSVHSNSTRS